MPGYLRMSFEGTLASGQEAWSTSCNFNLLGSGGPDEGDLNAWCQEVADDLGTLVTSQLSNLLSLQGKITAIKAYYYTAIGSPATIVGAASANFTGGATPSMPLQTAMVFSLKTPLAGRRNRGRMYWPAQGAGVMSGGRFSSSDHTGAPPDLVLLLAGVCGRWPGIGTIEPAVVSAAGNTVTPVTSISVGDVPDTQRRRRDNLVEQYATAQYPG